MLGIDLDDTIWKAHINLIFSVLLFSGIYCAGDSNMILHAFLDLHILIRLYIYIYIYIYLFTYLFIYLFIYLFYTCEGKQETFIYSRKKNNVLYSCYTRVLTVDFYWKFSKNFYAEHWPENIFLGHAFDFLCSLS